MKRNELMSTRYKVKHNLPFITEFRKDDVLNGEYLRVEQGLLEFNEHPEHFKKLIWYSDRKIKDLPEYKLKCVSDYDNGDHTITAGEDYLIYDYNIGYSIKEGHFKYAVKVHLPNGIGTFPLNNFVPPNEDKI